MMSPLVVATLTERTITSLSLHRLAMISQTLAPNLTFAAKDRWGENRLPRRGWSLVIYDKSLGRALGRTSSRLPGRRRQAEEAGGILPHELLRRLLAERLPPRDHGLGMVGIDRLRVGVIRLEHEDVIAEDVDHRAGQLDALGEVDAAEDAPHLGVLERRVLQRR